MFEQVTRKEPPSGGLAISLTLLHQFIGAPGTFLVALPLAAFVEHVLRETHSYFGFGELVVLLLCLGIAFLVGHGIGYVFPGRAGYGYWSGVVPTGFLLLSFWLDLGFHNLSIKQKVRNAFFPDDNSIDFTLGTIPWLQSFFYSFGLRLGVKYKRRKREPAS